MSTYTPDKWVVLKLTSSEGGVHYRVFGCWYGGFTGSNRWKMNSGITEASFDSFEYVFVGASGSAYHCHVTNYGTHMYGQSIIDDFMRNAKAAGGDIEIMPGDTDWTKLDYSE